MFSNAARAETPFATIESVVIGSEAPYIDQAVEIKGAQGSRKGGANAPLFIGDHVVTDAKQSATVKLRDESELTIAPSSDVMMGELVSQDNKHSPSIGLVMGMLRALVKKVAAGENPLMVRTPSAVMGVRGTDFVVEHDGEGQTTLHTIDGKVALGKVGADIDAPGGSHAVSAGEMSFFKKGMDAPEPPAKYNMKTLTDHLSQRCPLIAQKVVAHHEELVRKAHAEAHEDAKEKKKQKPKWKPHKAPRPVSH
jgi:hypothetical protein